MAASEAAKEAVWLRNFMLDLGVVPSMQLPITLYCDNSRAFANSMCFPIRRESTLSTNII